ncbi:hypothetical protein ACR2XG_28750, partial [Klebsiella pneumoniae]
LRSLANYRILWNGVVLLVDYFGKILEFLEVGFRVKRNEKVNMCLDLSTRHLFSILAISQNL